MKTARKCEISVSVFICSVFIGMLYTLPWKQLISSVADFKIRAAWVRGAHHHPVTTKVVAQRRVWGWQTYRLDTVVKFKEEMEKHRLRSAVFLWGWAEFGLFCHQSGYTPSSPLIILAHERLLSFNTPRCWSLWWTGLAFCWKLIHQDLRDRKSVV